jgi:hypothetical protein
MATFRQLLIPVLIAAALEAAGGTPRPTLASSSPTGNPAGNPPRPSAENPIAKRQSAEPRVELQKILRTVEAGEFSVPIIHSSQYCEALEPRMQGSCDAGNAVGRKIYAVLSAEHKELGAASLSDFARTVESLSKLRDRLWEGKAIGNIALAELIDRVIYWRIVERIGTVPTQELPRLSPLLSHYRFIESDWMSVRHAVETETGSKFDVPSDVPGEDFRRAYSLMLSQRYASAGEFSLGLFRVDEVLDKLDVDSLVLKLANSRSPKKTLSYFLSLRMQVGSFSTATEETIILGGPPELPMVTTVAAQKFEVWVKRFIPQALKDQEQGSKVPIKIGALHRMYLDSRKLSQDFPGISPRDLPLVRPLDFIYRAE